MRFISMLAISAGCCLSMALSASAATVVLKPRLLPASAFAKPMGQAPAANAVSCYLAASSTEFPQLVLRNAGTQAWNPKDGIAVSFSSGVMFSVTLPYGVAPGQSISMILPDSVNGVPKGTCLAHK